jgi:hypothetical protein
MRVAVEALLIAMCSTAILVGVASVGYLTPLSTVAVVHANEGFQAKVLSRITPIISAADQDYDTVAIELAQAFVGLALAGTSRSGTPAAPGRL